MVFFFSGNDDDNSNLKNGSLKRTASFSFENDEDIIACDEPTSTERALEKLYSAIGIVYFVLIQFISNHLIVNLLIYFYFYFYLYYRKTRKGN